MLRFVSSRVLPIASVVTLVLAGVGIQPTPTRAQAEPMCVTYANGVERCIGMNGEGVPESVTVTGQAVTIAAASEEAPLQLQPIDPEDLLPPPETVEPMPTPKKEQEEERADRDRDGGRDRDGRNDGKERDRDGHGGRDDGRGGRDHDRRGEGIARLILLLRQIAQVRAGQFPVPHAPIFFIPCLILEYNVTHPEECGSVVPPGAGEGPRIT